ncbi:uncharacterized protein METZ01_LOCUS260013, partial [marine metagenome]
VIIDRALRKLNSDISCAVRTRMLVA